MSDHNKRVLYDFVMVILMLLDTTSWGLLLTYNLDPVYGHMYKTSLIIILWAFEAILILYIGSKALKSVKHNPKNK